MNGKLVTDHIVRSSAPTFPATEWVKIEIEVRGNKEIIHRVNGKEVESEELIRFRFPGRRDVQAVINSAASHAQLLAAR